MPRVLIIDDSAGFRASARLLREADGFNVAEAASGGAGIRVARELEPELVLVDIRA
jgi:CheY-like chemotaxis protein